MINQHSLCPNTSLDGMYRGTLNDVCFEMELGSPDFFVLKGYLNRNFSGHRTIPSDPLNFEIIPEGIMIQTRSGSLYLLEVDGEISEESNIVKELKEIKERGCYWNSTMRKSVKEN